MPLRVKLILAFLITALVPFGTIGFFQLLDFQQTITQEITERLDALASTESSRVQSALDGYFDELHHISSLALLTQNLNRYETNATKGDRSEITRTLLDVTMGIEARTRGFRLLDASGIPVASTDGDLFMHAEDTPGLNRGTVNSATLVGIMK